MGKITECVPIITFNPGMLLHHDSKKTAYSLHNFLAFSFVLMMVLSFGSIALIKFPNIGTKIITMSQADLRDVNTTTMKPAEFGLEFDFYFSIAKNKTGKN